MAKVYYFIGLLIVCIPCASYYCYNHGFEEGDTVGYERGFSEGFSEGHDKGYAEGEKDGYKLGAEENSTAIELALRGAAFVFVDEDAETSFKYQFIVEKLDTLRKASSIQEGIDDLVEVSAVEIYESLLNFAGLNSSYTHERFTQDYLQKKNLISETVYNSYMDGVAVENQKSDDHRSAYEKTEKFTDGLSSAFCHIVDLLSPAEKYKIALTLLEIGEYASQELNLKLRSPKLAVDFIQSKLCGIILENSFEFIIQLFYDHARVKDFVSKITVLDHSRDYVKKIVTIEDMVQISLDTSFHRPFAFDPVFKTSIRAKVSASVDLDKFFKIEVFQKDLTHNGIAEIVITLPIPEIEKPTLDLELKSVRDWFGTTLSASEIEALLSSSRSKAIQEAKRRNIINEAKLSTEKAFNALFFPMINNAKGKYKLTVKYLEVELSSSNVKG